MDSVTDSVKAANFRESDGAERLIIGLVRDLVVCVMVLPLAVCLGLWHDVQRCGLCIYDSARQDMHHK